MLNKRRKKPTCSLEKKITSVDAERKKKVKFYQQTDFTCRSAVRINSHVVPIRCEIVCRSDSVESVLARCLNTDL